MKCIVKDCENHSHQGRFVGDLCSPCFLFISGDGGLYSQAYRNTRTMILQAVAAEREACAGECDEWIKNGSALAEDIATAIRARGNT